MLAEANLFDHPEPVLGVVWDGTGFGEDGQIWGGEFFRYGGTERLIQRVAHWEAFPHLLGDKMPREPRLSALACSVGIAAAERILRPRFTDVEWDLYRRMLDRGSELSSTSVGRLFDAVACLLGLADRVVFAGYRSDVADAISVFDVATLTSLWEGLPRVLVQYSLLEKPIVTFEVEGSRDLHGRGYRLIMLLPDKAGGQTFEVVGAPDDPRLHPVRD